MTMRAYPSPLEARDASAIGRTFPARRALANNALWLLGSNVFYSACQWLTVVAIVKSHAANALGHYGLASAVAAPIVVLSTMALRSFQATDVLRRYAFADYLNLRLAANVVAGVAIGVAGLAGAAPDGAASLLVPISVAKLVEVTSETCYGLAQRHDRVRSVALSQALRACVGLTALIVALTLGGTLVTAVWALAGAWIVVLLAVDLPGAQALEPVFARPRVARLASLAGECLPLGAQSAVVALTQGLPRYLLQASHGAAAVGYFTALSGITPALAQLASAVGQAAAPQLGWKAAGDLRSYRRLVFRLLAAAAALSAVLTLGAVLVGRQFLTVAYAPDYAAYETAFVLLVLGAGLSVVNTMAYFSLLAVRRHGLLLAMQCFGLLTTAATGIWLIPRFGLSGAAVAVALGGAASAAPGAHVLLRGPLTRMRRDPGLACVLAVLLLAASTGWTTESTDVGTVRFAKGAATSFDRYTRDPTPAQQAWMQAHYARMRAYSPYFDARLAWFPKAWVYKDLYAIYVDSPLVDAHPDWILRDGGGDRLYIPYDCKGGTCPQYAADIGNPAFRADWVAGARATLGKGYVGLFVDDVNMDLSRVGNGAGSAVVPRDPRTGSAMTNADWRRYMAEFTEDIRRAFPTHEIVHNALWFFGHDDPFIQRQLLSADYIEVERGVNDAGVRGGSGRYGFERLLAYIDWVHARGRGIVFDAGADTDTAREYGLAAYFLVDAGRDLLGNDPGGAPDEWWSGYGVGLGAPAAARYTWRGVLRRDFQQGVVLVNPPDAAPRTLGLDQPHTDLAGRQRASVTLGPAEGAVLRSALPVPRAIDIRPEVN